MVDGNVFVDGDNAHVRVVSSSGTSQNNVIINNIFDSTAALPVQNTGTGTVIRNNQGYVTESSGTGAIASGATTAVVTHGLSVTPTLDDISIVFGEQGSNDYGRFSVGTITSTQFTLTVAADPGASNLDFGWRVVAL